MWEDRLQNSVGKRAEKDANIRLPGSDLHDGVGEVDVKYDVGIPPDELAEKRNQ
jgi:hypothetical protein